MIRESPQRLERTLVTLLQEIFQETVNLWTTMRGFLNKRGNKCMMLMACNVVAHFEHYAILFKGYCVL